MDDWGQFQRNDMFIIEYVGILEKWLKSNSNIK